MYLLKTSITKMAAQAYIKFQEALICKLTMFTRPMKIPSANMNIQKENNRQKFFQSKHLFKHSGSSLKHSRKRAALLMAAFTKPRLNSHTKILLLHILVSGRRHFQRLRIRLFLCF